MKPAILIALLLFCAGPARAQDDLRKKIDSIYESGGYERDLPGPGKAPAKRKPITVEPEDSGPNRREIRIAPPEVASGEHRAPFGSLLSVLPWVAVAAISAILIASHVRTRLAEKKSRAKPEAAVAFGARARSIEPELADARALAAEGRFAEAIHALLLQAIARVGAGAASTFAPSLTSRELSATAPLGPPARAALGRLVHAVEVSRFGGRPAGPADFESCEAELERIVT